MVILLKKTYFQRKSIHKKRIFLEKCLLEKWIFTFCFKSSDPSEYSSVESDESYSFDFGVLRTSFDLPRFDLGSDFVLRESVA